MPVTPPTKDAPGRQPSLRGVLMIDTVHGKMRVRKWPRKRGKKRTPGELRTQKKFAAMQMATKYFAPRLFADLMGMVEGTPLLPRDIMTMMLSGRLFAFILDDGKVLWPMEARTDVSDALDAIANQPGQSLIRGENGWQAFEGGGSGGLSLLVDEPIVPEGGAWASPSLFGKDAIVIVVTGCTATTNAQRALQFSEDDGDSWVDAIDSYAYLDVDGITAYSEAVFPHSSQAGAERGFIVIGLGLGDPETSFFLVPLRNRLYYVPGLNAPLTNLRIVNANSNGISGAITGGRVRIWTA